MGGTSGLLCATFLDIFSLQYWPQTRTFGRNLLLAEMENIRIHRLLNSRWAP